MAAAGSAGSSGSAPFWLLFNTIKIQYIMLTRSTVSTTVDDRVDELPVVRNNLIVSASLCAALRDGRGQQAPLGAEERARLLLLNLSVPR